MRRTERPVQTRFRFAFAYRLKLARHTNSLTHYTKGTPSPLRAPTVCRHPVSGALSLPSSGCFSPFPHGTSSLSVAEEYLGLEGGPPMFRQGFTCPALLKASSLSTRTGLSPAMARLSRRFRFFKMRHWPGPLSLATTSGVSVDVLSSRYLDVSVPWVRFETLCIQVSIPPLTTRSRGARVATCASNSRGRKWVSPFGNPRIKACSQLPTAYRSVPRPSSPLSTKASTERP
jgi:hypothetical protein